MTISLEENRKKCWVKYEWSRIFSPEITTMNDLFCFPCIFYMVKIILGPDFLFESMKTISSYNKMLH